MIDLIRQLVEFLSQDALTVEDTVARMGAAINDPGGLLPVEVKPVIQGVSEASVSRDPESGLPYLLTIALTADKPLTPAMLQDAFGSYKRLRTERGQPPEVIFYPTSSGSPWRVAVVATVPTALEPLDDQQVSSITFRRER